MESQQSTIINKIIGGIISLGVIGGVTAVAVKTQKTETPTPITKVAGTEESGNTITDTEKEGTSTTQSAQTIQNKKSDDGDDNDNENENGDDTDNEDNTAKTQTTRQTSIPKVPTIQTTGAYKDGTYSAVGSYNSPAGTEQVSVSLVLKNNIVTDSTFSATSNSGRSKAYQNEFASGYKAFVIGKNISTINVGKVSGSSLTGTGFNNALAKIKAQAKI
jgi:hypothetical protein